MYLYVCTCVEDVYIIPQYMNMCAFSKVPMIMFDDRDDFRWTVVFWR